MTVLSKRAAGIATPPIDIITREVIKMRNLGKRVINLGQAVCNLPLSFNLIPGLKESLDEQIINSYTPDPGLLELRERIAEKYFNLFGVIFNPSEEIIITAGANQAFAEVLAAIADPQDEIILCSPYYFDHEFAVKAAGCVPVISNLRENDLGFSINLDDIASKISPNTKAIVIVTPNNPTGAVFDFNDVAALGDIVKKNNIYLISDETYDEFVFSPKKIYSAAQLNAKQNIIIVASFSKTFGLAGMRIGYITAPSRLYDELLKIQDAMIVCAPYIAQIAALICFKEKTDWFEGRRKIIEERKNLVTKHLAEIKVFENHPVEGAFFAFPKYNLPISSLELTLEVLNKTGIALIHGSAFGQAGEEHLRISFGNTDTQDLIEALEILKSFFKEIDIQDFAKK